MSKLFDPQVEVFFLSILLNNPSKILELHGFNANMLTLDSHIIIFKNIKELLEENRNPDIRLLIATLQSKGSLEEVGGDEYLNYLYQQEVDEINLGEFEKIITDSFKAQKLLQVTKDVHTNLKNVANVDNQIVTLRSQLDSLNLVSNGSNVHKINELIDDTYESIVERKENPGVKGFTTGFEDIDLITSGFNPSEIWILCGRPGHGKTSTALNLMLQGARKGISSLLFSLEMNQRSLMERFVALETGIPLSPNIRMGSLSTPDLQNIKDTLETFRELPIYMDASFTPTLGYFETTIRKYKYRHNINVVYLDYIQLLSERGEESTHELGRISRRCKLLANELDMTIVILSQLNRLVELRNDHKPILSDLRQSGNLEEDTDLAIGLYRDALYNKDSKNKNLLEFIILKQRNGPVGSIFLKFNEQTNKVYQ